MEWHKLDGKAPDLPYFCIAPIIREAWCRETASPGCVEQWSEDNPSFGQCAVTALLIQEIYGGVLLRTYVEGFGSHYYNRFPHGTEVDLTRDQFPEGTIVPPGEPRSMDRTCFSEPAVKACTMPRYRLLKSRCRELIIRLNEAVQEEAR